MLLPSHLSSSVSLRSDLHLHSAGLLRLPWSSPIAFHMGISPHQTLAPLTQYHIHFSENLDLYTELRSQLPTQNCVTFGNCYIVLAFSVSCSVKWKGGSKSTHLIMLWWLHVITLTHLPTVAVCKRASCFKGPWFSSCLWTWWQQLSVLASVLSESTLGLPLLWNKLSKCLLSH